ncbi:MAG: hypothetical protein DLM54_09690 [Acidimicrobiales bacterium]|nr:MAG: hypothetical protein DLM54_09690 [Acidimicrobiales bacterium]
MLEPSSGEGPMAPDGLDPLDVEISVVNHQGRELLRACLSTLPAAIGGLRWHATVVDNASGDGSLEMLQQEFPWAKVLLNRVRHGFGFNHNQVIRPVVANGSARYVLVLNNDTELYPGSIQELVAFADSDPDIGATGPPLVNTDGSPQVSFCPFPRLVSHLRSEFLRRNPRGMGGAKEGWLSGACLLVRTTALRDVGAFDTRFFLFFEDVDLALRLRSAGWASRLSTTTPVVHHYHATVARPELRLPMERQMLRSRYLYLRKHHGLLTAWAAAIITDVALALRSAKTLMHSAQQGQNFTGPAPSFLLRLAWMNPRQRLLHEKLSVGTSHASGRRSLLRSKAARTCQSAAALSRTLRDLRGRGRVGTILHGLVAERLYHEAATWKVPMRRGHQMESPWSTVQSWTAAFTGRYDDAEIDLLLRFADRGTLLLDVGASVGFWAVPLALAAHRRQSRLVAIEPLAANRPLLRANVERNGLATVVDICPVALGSTQGQAIAVVERGGVGNASLNTPIPQDGDAVAAIWTETVQITTLDALVMPPSTAGLRCSIIKLDVEGLEMAVLEGGASFLAHHHPVILGEFSPEWFAMRGIPLDAPQRWAQRTGYLCHEVVRKRSGRFSDQLTVPLEVRLIGEPRGDGPLLLTPPGMAIPDSQGTMGLRRSFHFRQ